MTQAPDDLARLALANISREYPNKPDHVLGGPGDVRSPRALHPAFYGSFDWHSSVHMHWLLVRLLRRRPGLSPPVRREVVTRLDAAFSPEAMAGETAYLREPFRAGFERTYGWAWLLELAAELIRLREAGGPAGAWVEHIAPLAGAFESRYLEFLPRAAYPIRAGTHANSAFGFLLALDYAETRGAPALAEAIRARATAWFAADRAAPVAYEPGGDDFLSPTLMEAALMARLLPRDRFAVWLDGFLPDPGGPAARAIREPVANADPDDPKHSHLDGLNLSRAWCWNRIAAAAGDGAVRAVARTAAERHREAGYPSVLGAGYMGAHWLATFGELAGESDRP